MKEHPRGLSTALMLGDVILTAGAFGIAFFLRFYSGLFSVRFIPSSQDVMLLLAMASPLTIIFLTYFGVYEARRALPISSVLPALFKTSVGLVVVLSTFIYFNRDIRFSRLTLLLFGLIFFALFAGERTLLRLGSKYLRRLGFNTKRLLVVGAGDLGQRVMRAIKYNPNYGYQLVGLIDDYVSNGIFQKDYGVDVLGRTNEIVKVASRHEIDKVIIALPYRAHEKISRLIERCENAGIDAEVVPDLFDFAKLRPALRSLEGLPLIGATSLPIKSWTYAVLKRWIDIVLALVLLVICAPLMVFLAVLINITSPGPVFFAQERVGLNGRRFNIIKFRTMLSNAQEILERKLREDPRLRAEWHADFKLKKDPRITPIGAFLRRTSLDELPQLFNVLRGEMSLVGPRPLPGYHQQKMSPRVRSLRNRVLPGMTGLWQISGRSEVGTEGMEIWDPHYVQNWSLWLDFSTLVKTIPVVLKGTGAL